MNIQGTFSELSVNIQRTFSDRTRLCVRHPAGRRHHIPQVSGGHLGQRRRPRPRAGPVPPAVRIPMVLPLVRSHRRLKL